jgi:hypothetical protein
MELGNGLAAGRRNDVRIVFSFGVGGEECWEVGFKRTGGCRGGVLKERCWAEPLSIISRYF